RRETARGKKGGDQLWCAPRPSRARRRTGSVSSRRSERSADHPSRDQRGAPSAELSHLRTGCAISHGGGRTILMAGGGISAEALVIKPRSPRSTRKVRTSNDANDCFCHFHATGARRGVSANEAPGCAGCCFEPGRRFHSANSDATSLQQ